MWTLGRPQTPHNQRRCSWRRKPCDVSATERPPPPPVRYGIGSPRPPLTLERPAARTRGFRRRFAVWSCPPGGADRARSTEAQSQPPLHRVFGRERQYEASSCCVTCHAPATASPAEVRDSTDRPPYSQSAAMRCRRRTPCNQTGAADTQRQQTPRSERLSQHSSWSPDSRACFHTAGVKGVLQGLPYAPA